MASAGQKFPILNACIYFTEYQAVLFNMILAFSR